MKEYQFKKNCVICCGEFETNYIKQVCCSSECRKQHKRNKSKEFRKKNPNYNTEYYHKHIEHIRELSRRSYRLRGYKKVKESLQNG